MKIQVTAQWAYMIADEFELFQRSTSIVPDERRYIAVQIAKERQNIMS